MKIITLCFIIMLQFRPVFAEGFSYGWTHNDPYIKSKIDKQEQVHLKDQEEMRE